MQAQRKGAISARGRTRPDKIHVASVTVSASAKGDSLSADICVVVSARYLDYTDINMICEVDETELERERPNAALYMCRCADGDLWTLAKNTAPTQRL